MKRQPENNRRFLPFVLRFFLAYILVFLLLYAIFPLLMNRVLLPLVKMEVAMLESKSTLLSIASTKKHIMAKIHYHIELIRYPNGDSSEQSGVLVLQGNLPLRDCILHLCLLLALALSWPGVIVSKRAKALVVVTLSWLCYFSLLQPFAILNDGLPPIGVRLTLIHWWNLFLTHKGAVILTLLFFLGNMYMMYLFGQKKEAGSASGNSP